MTGYFQEFGLRFVYPLDWDLDVNDEETQVTVTISAPDGPAFVLIRADTERPEPSSLAAEALAAMCGEYEGVESTAVEEMMAGYPAVGHDLDFLSLDMPNTCSIRSFRTKRRTVLYFAQWSDLDETGIAETLRRLRNSLEETSD